MFAWIASNILTIVVCAVLLAVVIAAVVSLTRDKKQGRHSCGGICSACALGSTCRSKQYPMEGAAAASVAGKEEL